MSKQKSVAKPDAVSASAPKVSHSALSANELEKSWKELVGLLAPEKDDVNHAQVEKIAEKIFNSSVASGSADGEALEVLSVSYVQQSKWGALVALLSAHPSLVQSNTNLAFHFAYALYRDKQHQKALDELKKRGSNLSDGELHLQAQAAYRAGNYSAAAKVYRDTHLSEDDDVELQSNMLAALVSAGLLDEAKAYIKQLAILTNPPSFELAYNASCCLIECGDFKAALTVVRKSQELCKELLEEDGASQQEINNELAVMRVQEAFLLQNLSKLPGATGTENDDASNIYNTVLNNHPSDPNVISIASNNMITLRGGGSNNVWDSLKKSSKAMENVDLKDMTLSTRQKSTIQLNRALALYHGKQFDKALNILSTLTKDFPSFAQNTLAMAAVLLKDKSKQREAEDLLNAWVKNNADSAPAEAVQSVSLGLAHLALVKGDFAGAAAQLVSLSKSKAGQALQYQPALVATVVSLYERSNDINSAHALIQDAVAFWKNASAKKDQVALRTYQLILSSAVAFYNKLGREQDAAGLLELLAAQTVAGSAEGRAESIARLVLAYRADEAKQAQYVKQLPALSVPASLDAKQLETVPAPEVAKKRKINKKVASTSASSSSVEVKDEGDEEEGEEAENDEAAVSASLAKAEARKKANALRRQRRRAKNGPKRYPKGFDPKNPGPMPDPERWLPRWERSNQKKYKRRQGNAIRGAQGSTNTANIPKEAESSGVEVTSKKTGAAAAAARKRAGKKK